MKITITFRGSWSGISYEERSSAIGSTKKNGFSGNLRKKHDLRSQFSDRERAKLTGTSTLG